MSCYNKKQENEEHYKKYTEKAIIPATNTKKEIDI